VREVDDARDAEDERQTGGEKKQRRGAGQTVDDLDEERGDGQGRLRIECGRGRESIRTAGGRV